MFDFKKAEIRPGGEAARNLKETAAILRQRAVKDVQIGGHTDSKGPAEYNLWLSQQRAEAVRNWLIDHEGLGDVAFTVKGFGSTQPAEPNNKPDGSDYPQGREKNRRVVIAFDR